MTDEAVRCQKTVIQDAHDFFKWASSSNMKGVTFLFVKSDECLRMDGLLKSRNIKPVKGTFKLHAVAPAGNGSVYVRDTSCYCGICLGGTVCDGWRKENLQKENEIIINQNEPDDTSVSDKNETIANEITPLQEGQYVAAKYNNRIYVGKITDIDYDDHEFEISFMESKKDKYQWPKHEDVLWIPANDILFSVSEPTATGRSGRMFELQQIDKERLDKVK